MVCLGSSVLVIVVAEPVARVDTGGTSFAPFNFARNVAALET